LQHVSFQCIQAVLRCGRLQWQQLQVGGEVSALLRRRRIVVIVVDMFVEVSIRRSVARYY